MIQKSDLSKMDSPEVSVIIPAYNGAGVIGEAIDSVLQQTYPYFEVIVVSDASPDHIESVIRHFTDPRIKYIAHQENRGLPATRNTGVRAARGQYVALLDQDDLFHPEKLQTHVDFLENNPEVGVSYNARFDVIGASRKIRNLWQPPQRVDLKDLLLGYPFAPSDMVLRKSWLLEIGLFDERNTFHGEDLNTNCRLALAGCAFQSVNRALNYRRYQPGRIRRNLDESLSAVLRNIELVLSDPRCPQEVIALREVALANNYQVWAYWALAQDETKLGQRYMREAVRLNPALLVGQPIPLIDFLITYCVDDERGELAVAMKRLFDQLPFELSALVQDYEAALARGFLLKGTRQIIWGFEDEADDYVKEAANLSVSIDESFVEFVIHQVLAIENEFGPQLAQAAISRLRPYLERGGDKRTMSQIEGKYFINKAFHSYRTGQYTAVPQKILRAVTSDPTHLTNKGVISMLLRSMAGKLAGKKVAPKS